MKNAIKLLRTIKKLTELNGSTFEQIANEKKIFKVVEANPNFGYVEFVRKGLRGLFVTQEDGTMLLNSYAQFNDEDLMLNLY